VGAWGSGAWGSSGWGGVLGLGEGLELVDVQPIAENMIRLVFNLSVYFSRLSNPGDASVIDRYAITTDSSTLGEDSHPPRPVFPAIARLTTIAGAGGRMIDLFTDRTLSPYPSRYVVAVNGLRSTTGELLTPGRTSLPFDGLTIGPDVFNPSLLVARGDFANPQTIGTPDGVTRLFGTFPIDETGDYAIDRGLVSYKKRIIRRLTTERGAFAHLPSYGVGVLSRVKLLARPSVIADLGAEAEEQIRLEPETAEVSVSVEPSTTTPGLVTFRVRARTTTGDAVNLGIPFNPGA
jgi:hypothetical protein